MQAITSRQVLQNELLQCTYNAPAGNAHLGRPLQAETMGRLQQMLLQLLPPLACLPVVQRAELPLEGAWQAAALEHLQPQASIDQPLGCCRQMKEQHCALHVDHLAVLHGTGRSLAAPARARTSSLRPRWTLWLRSPSCNIPSVEGAAWCGGPLLHMQWQEHAGQRQDRETHHGLT